MTLLDWRKIFKKFESKRIICCLLTYKFTKWFMTFIDRVYHESCVILDHIVRVVSTSCIENGFWWFSIFFKRRTDAWRWSWRFQELHIVTIAGLFWWIFFRIKFPSNYFSSTNRSIWIAFKFPRRWAAATIGAPCNGQKKEEEKVHDEPSTPKRKDLMKKLLDPVIKEKLHARFTIRLRRMNVVELPDANACQAAAKTSFKETLK